MMPPLTPAVPAAADVARVSRNDPADAGDWVNFYRSDDYAATAYFYLDRPSDDLPSLARVEDR